MFLKLQLMMQPTIARSVDGVPELPQLLAQLLTPASFLAYMLALWRLGADLQWTGEFAISSGLFSHWQVWLALAALLQVAGSMLRRYHRDDDSIIP